MKDDVIRLLNEGKSYSEIVRVVGCSKSTISHHAKALGLRKKRARIDWEEVQNYYDVGHSVRECAEKFKFALASWSAAARRGEVTGRGPTPISEYLKRGTKARRHNIKRRLLAEELLTNECAVCGLGPEWNGRELVLVLDHVNGINDDYRLRNLRMLCPNCDSQSPTFAGRNKKNKRRSGVV